MSCEVKMKLRKNWFYVTQSGKVVGPIKTDHLLYRSPAWGQKKERWKCSGKHVSDNGLDLIAGFELHEEAHTFAANMRQPQVA
jgi:hypothetical protein